MKHALAFLLAALFGALVGWCTACFPAVKYPESSPLSVNEAQDVAWAREAWRESMAGCPVALEKLRAVWVVRYETPIRYHADGSFDIGMFDRSTKQLSLSYGWIRDQAPVGDKPLARRAVAAHEFGHALGLDHTKGYDTCMQPSARWDCTASGLQARDVAAARKLNGC